MLTDLELGEINIICLRNCISHPSTGGGNTLQCFQNCETSLTRLMKEGKYDLVPTMEFKV